jgi:hypothetical protein
VSSEELIDQINPVIRGWGLYYHKAHVRKLFNRLDRWIVRRIRSHRYKRWRNTGWKTLPESKLYGDYGLVNLIHLIPSIVTVHGLMPLFPDSLAITGRTGFLPWLATLCSDAVVATRPLGAAPRKDWRQDLEPGVWI